MKFRHFLIVFAALLIFSCKSADSSQTPEAAVATISPANSQPAGATPVSPLDKETQHRFEGLVKQGDHFYAEGNFREALDYYKKAQAIAPDQLSNEKLIAMR